MAPQTLSSPPSEPVPPTSDSSPSDKGFPEQQDTSEIEPRRPRRSRPKDFPESQASKLWRELGTPAGGPVNELPGGTYNTAGGKPKEHSWRDAFRFDQFNNPNKPPVFKQPCARDALLVGICVGGGVGGLRFILRGLSGMMLTANYAVGGFATSSIGMFWWCQQRRKEEARGMAAAVAGMKMLHEKRAREEAEKKKAEHEKQRIEEDERIRNKKWWKPWS